MWFALDPPFLFAAACGAFVFSLCRPRKPKPTLFPAPRRLQPSGRLRPR